MYKGKPIIGVIGGIGSGKSFVARLMGEVGCCVVDSDAAVSAAYARPEVREQLRRWWGDGVLTETGTVDRKAIARKVFENPAERARLEGLLHPLVAQLRDEQMAAADPQVIAFVWDTPLLVEAGLASMCDAIVFVEVPEPIRWERVRQSRGWSRQEWEQREKIQLPLDKKRKMAKYMVDNTAGADEVRVQVRKMLSRIVDEINDRERRKA